jgi:hypothetical protein
MVRTLQVNVSPTIITNFRIEIIYLHYKGDSKNYM